MTCASDRALAGAHHGTRLWAFVLASMLGCASNDPASVMASAASTGCAELPASSPFGARQGDVLVNASLEAVLEDGRTKTLALHDTVSHCGEEARVLVLRVQAGFSGTCKWLASHASATPTEVRDRVRVIDVLVRDVDGDSPTLEAASDWQRGQSPVTPVAIDESMQLVVPGATLPRVLVVDPRTMKIKSALNDPAPGALRDAVRSAVADFVGQPAPSLEPVSRVDGRFTENQWSMVGAMVMAGAPPPDPTNAFAERREASALGAVLFDDKRLSPTTSVSCGKCHERERGFSDGSETPTGGVRGGGRNTPSVLLAAWSRWQLWDGRADTLWMQALLPLEDPNEFDSSRLFVAHRVFELHRRPYESLFGTMPPLDDTARFPETGKPGDAAWERMTRGDQELVNRVFVNVGKSIAAFERTLRVSPNPVDAYASGNRDALTEEQKDGLLAFFEVGCAQCHYGPRLTDDAFHNIRFPTGRRDLSADRGRIDGMSQYATALFRADGAFSDATTVARKRVTAPAMLGAFKTPSLRGVSVTRPYGHGGSVPDRTMAVDLHRTLGLPAGSRLTTGTVDPWLVPFDAARVPKIVAFLNAMSFGTPAAGVVGD